MRSTKVPNNWSLGGANYPNALKKNKKLRHGEHAFGSLKPGVRICASVRDHAETVAHMCIWSEASVIAYSPVRNFLLGELYSSTS